MIVGVLDNHKRNAGVDVAELSRVLQQDDGVAKVVTYRKASQGIHTLVESSQETGRGVLETIVGSMTAGGISGYSCQSWGASVLIVLGPEHAAEIAADDF